MAADRNGQHYVAVEHRGRAFRVLVDINGTLKDAANSIAIATSTAPSTLKLLQGGRACTPSKAPQRPLADSGGARESWTAYRMLLIRSTWIHALWCCRSALGH